MRPKCIEYLSTKMSKPSQRFLATINQLAPMLAVLGCSAAAWDSLAAMRRRSRTCSARLINLAHESPVGCALLAVTACSAVLVATACSAVRLEDLETARPVPPGSCVVVGFLGGRDAWNDGDKGVRQTALTLRDPAARVYAETFENRRRDVALAFVLEALDRDGDRRIDPIEAEATKLVVYGQSFGGAAVVKFARQLDDDDLALTVELTVQVDSVGRGDGEIPPNVRHALNLYQDSGLVLEGEHPIEAEDPSRTRVLGNWHFDYNGPPGSTISVDDLSLWKLFLRVAHAKMDRDPRVWESVRAMLTGACEGQDLRGLAERVQETLR